MADVPSGLVTFLFTDIEGSTKLAQEFPETLPAALDKHHTILTSAIESNNGFVFEIVGDAFCCSFEKAEDAVKAAVDAQLNLAKEKWEDAVIRIRIGIHSGNAEWNGKNYMGYITLARTARVMSSAYGEQILISNDTYELIDFTKLGLRNERNLQISFRNLGERRLKDVIQPIRLFQVVFPGLREDFPPLKTLDARPNNLPVQLTSFIGREAEIKIVKDLLKQTRLLTLTGSGGAGKTRLAMQVGADMIDDFSNGVFIAELASVSDPSFIVHTLMNSLGIKEEAGMSPENTMSGYLKDKEMLLILDNCEHLINDCAKLAEILLKKCPKLKMIATSREGLNFQGEQTYRLPSLTLPDTTVNNTPEQLARYEAVRLFIERALAVNPAFRVNNDNALALAQICYQLDGIPLAIELAAVRVKVLTVNKICERLNNRFKLLTGGKRTALPRQQTLKALIDWSYDLLSEDEKILWSRLSVFSGGWSLESAEDICSDENISKDEILDLLSALSEKSIIIFDSDKERYRILETLKQYGEEKLKEANRAIKISSKHSDYFLKLSEIAEPYLKSIESQDWLDKLESEKDNFHSAIIWSVSNNEMENGSRIAGALGRFWKIRGYHSTGRKLLELILDNDQGLNNRILRKILTWNGILSHDQGEHELALNFHNKSLVISTELNDKIWIASTINSLGAIEADRGNYEKAREYYNESLALRRETGDEFDIARTLGNLGSLAYEQGNFEQAHKFYNESLELKRRIGNKYSIEETLYNLGNIAYAKGDYEQAQKFQEDCIALNRELGNKIGLANSLNNLGKTEFTRGNYEHAKKYYEESLIIQKGIGDKSGISYSLNDIGNLYLQLENFEQAGNCFEDSLTNFHSMGEKLGIAISLNNLGKLAFIKKEYSNSRKFIEESLAISREIGDKWGIALTINGLGNLAFCDGNYEQAQKYYKESLTLKQDMGDIRGILFTLIGLSGILCAGNQANDAAIILSSVESIQRSIDCILEINEEYLKKQIINNLHEKLNNEDYLKYFEKGKDADARAVSGASAFQCSMINVQCSIKFVICNL